jgi:hypothetical protein
MGCRLCNLSIAHLAGRMLPGTDTDYLPIAETGNGAALAASIPELAAAARQAGLRFAIGSMCELKDEAGVRALVKQLADEKSHPARSALAAKLGSTTKQVQKSTAAEASPPLASMLVWRAMLQEVQDAAGSQVHALEAAHGQISVMTSLVRLWSCRTLVGVSVFPSSRALGVDGVHHFYACLRLYIASACPRHDLQCSKWSSMARRLHGIDVVHLQMLQRAGAQAGMLRLADFAALDSYIQQQWLKGSEEAHAQYRHLVQSVLGASSCIAMKQFCSNCCLATPSDRHMLTLRHAQGVPPSAWRAQCRHVRGHCASNAAGARPTRCSAAAPLPLPCAC